MNAMPNPSWGEDAYKDGCWAAKYEWQLLSKAMVGTMAAVSSMEADQSEATDFVTTGGSVKWASRVRRMTSAKRFMDVTIRAWRKSNARTEIEKLKNPSTRPDLYLFGWIEDGTRELRRLIVFDVAKFVDSGLMNDAKVTKNRDGRTAFISVTIEKIQDVEALVYGVDYPERPVSFLYSTSLKQQDDWMKEQRHPDWVDTTGY